MLRAFINASIRAVTQKAAIYATADTAIVSSKTEDVVLAIPACVCSRVLMVVCARMEYVDVDRDGLAIHVRTT